MKTETPKFGDVYEWRGALAKGQRIMYIGSGKGSTSAVQLTSAFDYGYHRGRISGEFVHISDTRWVPVEKSDD